MPPRRASRRATIRTPSEESQEEYGFEQQEVHQPARRNPSRGSRGEGQSSQPSRRPGKEPATSSYHPPSPPRASSSGYPTLEEADQGFGDIGKIPESDYRKPPLSRPDYFDYLANQKRFVKDFDEDKYHSGCALDLSCLDRWNILVHFERQGWIPFLTMMENSYVTLMRLFYANLRMLNTKPDCISYFQKDYINLDAELIANLLGIPNDGYDIFQFNIKNFEYPDGHDMDKANDFLHKEPSARTLISNKTSELFDVCRLMASVLNFTVLSKIRKGECFGCHKLLTYLILNDIKVNLPKLILYQMHSFTQTISNYGYGMVVTRIFRALDVDFSDLDFMEPHVYGAKHVHKMPIHPDNPRPYPVHPLPPVDQPAFQPEPQPEPEAEFVPEYHHVPPVQPPYGSYEHINQRLTHIHQQQEVTSTRLTEYIEESRAETSAIKNILNQILACVRPSSSSPSRRRRRHHSSSSSGQSGHQ